MAASAWAALAEPSAREPEAVTASAAYSLPRLLPASRGAVHYVAPNGDDAAPGTKDKPWRTVQKALDTLRPGQRALVRRGTYAEDLAARRAGRATAPITISAFGRERAVLRPRSSSGDTYALRLTSRAAYLRFSGFVIENARGTSSTNVYFEDGSHHVEVSRNEIRYSQDQGIFAEGSSRAHFILANRIHDNGKGHVSGQHQSHGIYLEGANHLVANNVIWGHPFGFGIQVYPGNRGSLIVNNTITGAGHSGIVVGGDDGVSNVVIRNNILAFNRSYGVQMDSDCPTGPVAVDSNVIHGNRSGSVEGGCSTVNTSRGNVSGDPKFVSTSGRNFQLRAGSPALNRARADYAPRSDVLGRKRPLGRGYDVGAFERR